MSSPAFSTPKSPAEAANGLKSLLAMLASAKGGATPAPAFPPEALRAFALKALHLLLEETDRGKAAREAAVRHVSNAAATALAILRRAEASP